MALDQSQSETAAGRKKEEKKFKGSEANIKLPQKRIPWLIRKMLLTFFIAFNIVPLVTANLEENAIVTAPSGKDFNRSFKPPVRLHSESVIYTFVYWNSQELIQYYPKDERIRWLLNSTRLKGRLYMTILNNGHVNIEIKDPKPEDSGTYTFQLFTFSDVDSRNTSFKVNFLDVESSSPIPENTTVESNSSIPENSTIPAILETDSPLPPIGPVVVVLVIVGCLVGLFLVGLVVCIRKRKRASCTELMRMASCLCKRQKPATSTDTTSSSHANGCPLLGKDLNTLEMKELKTLGGNARLNDSDLRQNQNLAGAQQGDGKENGHSWKASERNSGLMKS